MRCDTGPVVGAMTHARILDSEHESRPTELCSTCPRRRPRTFRRFRDNYSNSGVVSVLNLQIASPGVSRQLKGMRSSKLFSVSIRGPV